MASLLPRFSSLTTYRNFARRAGGFCVFAFLAAATAGSQQKTARSPAFEQVAAEAAQAREANDVTKAVTLYRRALALSPRWAEGWWYLGTLLYDRDAYGEAAQAFRKASALDSKVGFSLVMLGLCEIKLGRDDDALKHIQQGRSLGDPADPQFRHVTLYQEGLLLLNQSDFWTAQATLDSLSREGVDNEDLTMALGCAVLRVRPSNLAKADPSTREMVRRAGWAEHFQTENKPDKAMREYDHLATDFPKAPNVQYAYGRSLVADRQSEKAIEAFQREIENTPNHVLARLEIAAIDSAMNPSAGLPYAKEALRLDPKNPLGHYFFGLLLLNTGQPERAVPELETAERALQDEARVHFALGNAYARAHRLDDAKRERAIFQRLDEKAKEAAGKGSEAQNADAVQRNSRAPAVPGQQKDLK